MSSLYTCVIITAALGVCWAWHRTHRHGPAPQSLAAQPAPLIAAAAPLARPLSGGFVQVPHELVRTLGKPHVTMYQLIQRWEFRRPDGHRSPCTASLRRIVQDWPGGGLKGEGYARKLLRELDQAGWIRRFPVAPTSGSRTGRAILTLQKRNVPEQLDLCPLPEPEGPEQLDLCEVLANPGDHPDHPSRDDRPDQGDHQDPLAVQATSDLASSPAVEGGDRGDQVIATITQIRKEEDVKIGRSRSPWEEPRMGPLPQRPAPDVTREWCNAVRRLTFLPFALMRVSCQQAEALGGIREHDHEKRHVGYIFPAWVAYWQARDGAPVVLCEPTKASARVMRVGGRLARYEGGKWVDLDGADITPKEDAG